jgi:ABC-type multidrug transport system fused ATPase/permease subunit
MTNAIAQTTVGVERVRACSTSTQSSPERPDALVPTKVRGAIAFENVAFGYDPDVPVLQGRLHSSVEPGQLVGIVGATGGGKSTIMSLLPRFYDPRSRVGCCSTASTFATTRSQALRDQIAFVLQDTVLFRGSIRENIAYGKADATDAEIVGGAKIANAHDFIMAMPHGYDTPVGERGLTLSGGQRQRIGIARAIVRDAPILLLDEPTAALDTESEKLVIEATERLMKGRTVITIAHRLSTIRDADKIIVIKDGVVCRTGHARRIARAWTACIRELHRIQFESAAPPPPARRE